MYELLFQSVSLLAWVPLLTIVGMHIATKNSSIVWLYMWQSLAITVLLCIFSLAKGGEGLLLSAILTFAVKVVVGPGLLLRLIRERDLKFSAGSYLGFPMTLCLLFALTIFFQSGLFLPLSELSKNFPELLPVALNSVFASLLLIVIRKGVLSQIIGILSMENGIVAFASLLHLSNPLSLEIGISFVILAWMAIATTFIALILRHFDTLDSTAMQRLREE